MRELKFGIEIEFFGNDEDTVIDALKDNGIIITNSDNYENIGWKLTTDSTVDDEGLELDSPILYEKDLPTVKLVLDTLKEIGCKVNRTCGIHVHHDINDFHMQDMKSLVIYYYNNQQVFNSLMTNDRLQHNEWCKEISYSHILGINRYSTMHNIAYFSYKGCVINTEAYLKYGTIEFRQHYGCLDSETVLNWIELTFRCVCYAKNKTIEINKITNVKNALFQFRKDLNLFNTPVSKFMNKKMIELNKAV